MSMDHDWGLRLFLLLREVDDCAFSRCIASVLSYKLPTTFRGFDVAIAIATLITTSSVRGMEMANAIRLVKHHVVPLMVRRFCELQLGCDPTSGSISAVEWLSIPAHALDEVVQGAVYFGSTGEIAAFKGQLQWVYLYVLAAG